MILGRLDACVPLLFFIDLLIFFLLLSATTAAAALALQIDKSQPRRHAYIMFSPATYIASVCLSVTFLMPAYYSYNVQIKFYASSVTAFGCKRFDNLSK